MFSEAARAKMLERGWSVASLLAFFRDSARESRESVRRRSRQVRSIARFAVGFYVATVVLAVLVYGGATVVPFAAYTLVGVVAFTAATVPSVSLLRRSDGTHVERVGVANYLTLARFYLIAPVLVFFHDGYAGAALATYLVLGFTDVADGVVARLRNERSEFGVIFDPLADVFSTAAVFTLFFAKGLIPGWLLALLMARYLMLFLGSFVLFLLTGPIRFRSTLPGKVVGVVQATGITAVIVCAMVGRGWLERVSGVLFPVLGAGFASIILSQFVIGLRHVRERTVRVDS
jgi:cardiolipin synthase